MKKISTTIISYFLTICVFLGMLSSSANAIVSGIELKPESTLEIEIIDGNKYISNISTNVSVDTLITHFVSESKISIKKNNSIASGSAIIGTGCIVSQGSDVAYTLIKGDVDGDGTISSTDYLLVKKYILNQVDLDEIFILASDTDDSGKVDSTDYLQIKRHLLGIYDLYPQKTVKLETEENIEISSSVSYDDSEYSFILNTKTKKIHLNTCSSAATITSANKKYSNEDYESLLSQGYLPCGTCIGNSIPDNSTSTDNPTSPSLDSIPEYSGSAYCIINNNIPSFTSSELTTIGYEKYSELDSLGRCGVAIASCGTEIMPTGSRGDISKITPTGWVQATYDCISTGSLYNRSHLIAWSLSGEDANEKNLITGTSYMNQGTMTQFENLVRDYINETNNHVAYRVTPLFKGNDLVCRGIQMEAYSVEDKGAGVCFNVYCYNVQPGVVIDYATGESHVENTDNSSDSTVEITSKYVINKNSKKIHLSTCGSVKSINTSNILQYDGNIDELVSQGYTTCATCIKENSSADNSSDISTETSTEASESPSNTPSESTYVLNIKTKRIHTSTCGSVKTILDENKQEYTGNIDDLIAQGYQTCGSCFKESTSTDTSETPSEGPSEPAVTYVLNTKSNKIHLSTCGSVKTILDENKQEYTGNIDSLISQGYTLCASCLKDSTSTDNSETPSEEPSVPAVTYVLNIKSKRIHTSTCGSVKTILEANKQEYTGNINDLIAQGYTTCGSCKPS